MRLKTVILSLVGSLVIAVGLAQPAFAVNVLQPCDAATASNSSVCQDAKKTDPKKNPLFGSQGIVTTYVHILAIVVAVGATIMMLISGMRFVVSGGDPQAIETAKKTAYYALVGLVVAAVAQTIVSFIIARL